MKEHCINCGAPIINEICQYCGTKHFVSKKSNLPRRPKWEDRIINNVIYLDDEEELNSIRREPAFVEFLPKDQYVDTAPNYGVVTKHIGIFNGFLVAFSEEYKREKSEYELFYKKIKEEESERKSRMYENMLNS